MKSMIWFHHVSPHKGLDVARTAARVGVRLVQAVLAQLPKSQLDSLVRHTPSDGPEEALLRSLAECEVGMRRAESAQHDSLKAVAKQQERAATAFGSLAGLLKEHKLKLSTAKRSRTTKTANEAA